MRRLVIFRVLVLALALAATRHAFAHPKPGAHADVRFSVDQRSVRGEFLMNLRFAQAVVNWPQALRDEVGAAEEPELRRALTEYLGGEPSGRAGSVVDRPNAVLINGVTVTPIVREFRIVIAQPETRPGFVDVAQAMLPQILMILDYPSRDQPRSVEFKWGTFPRDFLAQDRDLAPLTDIDAVILAEGDAIPVVFTVGAPTHTWKASATSLADRFQAVPTPAAPRRRTVPALSVVVLMLGAGLVAGAWRMGASSGPVRFVRGAVVASLAIGAAVAVGSVGRVPAPRWADSGPALPTVEEAAQVFKPVHANMYRAFDYVAEEDIYDALARSVDGPLLAKTYDEIYRSLIMHEEGGALSRIRSVRPMETNVDLIDADESGHPRLTVTARWRVDGVVFHWGHSHERTNEYLARYTLASAGGAWRITGVVPLEQRRVEVVPAVASGGAP
jgi:hypothetical protein